jgi:hypothetical protein
MVGEPADEPTLVSEWAKRAGGAPTVVDPSVTGTHSHCALVPVP